MYYFFFRTMKITKTWGNVIAAKKEKNNALNIFMSLNKKYNTAIPIKDTNQYKKAVLTYKLKFLTLNFPFK